MTLAKLQIDNLAIQWRNFITFSPMAAEAKKDLTYILDQLANHPEGQKLLQDIYTKLGTLTIHANEQHVCYFEHDFESVAAINQLNVGYQTIKNTAYRGVDDQLYYTSVNRAFIHELAHAADTWQSDYILHRKGVLKPEGTKMTPEESAAFDQKMAEQLIEHENIAIRRSNVLMQQLYGEVPQKTFAECPQPVESLVSSQWQALVYRTTGNIAIPLQTKKMELEHGLQTASEKFTAARDDSTHAPIIQGFRLHMGTFKPKSAIAASPHHR